jgi:hypothetical protein
MRDAPDHCMVDGRGAHRETTLLAKMAAASQPQAAELPPPGAEPAGPAESDSTNASAAGALALRKRKRAATGRLRAPGEPAQESAAAVAGAGASVDAGGEAPREHDAGQQGAEDGSGSAEDEAPDASAVRKRQRTEAQHRAQGSGVGVQLVARGGRKEAVGHYESDRAVTNNRDANVAVAVEPAAREDAKGASSKPKWVGPQRASSNVRAINRVDFQPDICKDYKQTGFCVFGDACKFMHDRGDYKAGWQMAKEWEEEQRAKQARALAGTDVRSAGADAREADEDALPFACHICRNEFADPVVTRCGHYFCQNCALTRFVKNSRCAVCGQQTEGVFNAAHKLAAAVRKRQASASDSQNPDEVATLSSEQAPARAATATPARTTQLGWAIPRAGE